MRYMWRFFWCLKCWWAMMRCGCCGCVFFAFYLDLQAWGPLGCRQMGVAAPYAVPWRKIAVVIFWTFCHSLHPVIISYNILLPSKCYIVPSKRCGTCHILTILYWLVVWNMALLFPYIYILGMSSSQLTFILWKAGQPPTSIITYLTSLALVWHPTRSDTWNHKATYTLTLSSCSLLPTPKLQLDGSHNPSHSIWKSGKPGQHWLTIKQIIIATLLIWNNC